MHKHDNLSVFLTQHYTALQRKKNYHGITAKNIN